ncbi:hypothetical protein [Polycladidibacter hongkongensis]|uniref:hypothetical protein n=1 Tax=Polycladidibacter hongkongensis TaxID=1647556 RepID=UPI000A8CCFB6|nr:hypothetical protein [Pseudovibrio hongkongensis]
MPLVIAVGLLVAVDALAVAVAAHKTGEAAQKSAPLAYASVAGIAVYFGGKWLNGKA